jgi:DNA-binding transcriptional MocR family regulator
MDTISFARGVPGPELLPIEELADCARTAIERDGAAALLYGHTLGYQPLREWIGAHHEVDPARVIVTNGSLQAFHFVLSAFGGAGRVIVERPTYDRPRKILTGFDEVPLDDDGLDVGQTPGRCGFSRTIRMGSFASKASRFRPCSSSRAA